MTKSWLEAGSPGLLGKLVERFLTSMPTLIARVADSAGAISKVVEIAAHSLKSNCARFGAIRVTELAAQAAQAEHAARSGALDEVRRLGAEIGSEYQRFEVQFKRHAAVAAVMRDAAAP